METDCDLCIQGVLWPTLLTWRLHFLSSACRGMVDGQLRGSARPFFIIFENKGKLIVDFSATNINIYYLAPAPCDSTIRIVSRVVTQGLVVAVIECKVYNKEDGKLLMTATHVKQDNVRPAKAWGKL